MGLKTVRLFAPDEIRWREIRKIPFKKNNPGRG
jgi:hypothetical protein